MQAPNRGKESGETQIHPGLQVAVGVAVESLGTMASSSASHAAGNGKEMAHPGVSFLLALEVEERKWAAPDSEGDAKSD